MERPNVFVLASECLHALFAAPFRHGQSHTSCNAGRAARSRHGARSHSARTKCVAMASVTIKARRFARGDILGMYKECLTLVRSFPSIKREELFQDIRTGESARSDPLGSRARLQTQPARRVLSLGLR